MMCLNKHIQHKNIIRGYATQIWLVDNRVRESHTHVSLTLYNSYRDLQNL